MKAENWYLKENRRANNIFKHVQHSASVHEIKIKKINYPVESTMIRLLTYRDANADE